MCAPAEFTCVSILITTTAVGYWIFSSHRGRFYLCQTYSVSLSVYIFIYFCIYFITTPHTHAQHNADKKTTCDTKQNKKLKKKTFVNTFFQNRQRPFYSELFNSYSSERLFIHRYTIHGHLAEFNIWVRHSSFLPSLQSTIRAQKIANNMAVAIQRRGSGAMIDEERRKYKLSV